MAEAFSFLLNEGSRIGTFMLGALAKAWPFLLVSIPLSVAINMAGVGRHLEKPLRKAPVLAIFFATALGAVSPLCSCSVIPVIYALLRGGVPLGPVMAFWLASPSMDPEVFFLSVTTLGWELAVWRLVATTILSLAGGFVAHGLDRAGFFGSGYLRQDPVLTTWSMTKALRSAGRRLGTALGLGPAPTAATQTVPSCACAPAPALASASTTCCNTMAAQDTPGPSCTTTSRTSCGCSDSVTSSAPATTPPRRVYDLRSLPLVLEATGTAANVTASACECTSASPVATTTTCDCSTSVATPAPAAMCDCATAGAPTVSDATKAFPWAELGRQSLSSVLFVGQFMILAYFLEALITFYLPTAWVVGTLGGNGPLEVITATLLGLPLYTTNLAALGILGGLVAKGMGGGAVLAFLIAGPTTTLPAMSAVFGIARPRVFFVYLAMSLVGALVLGQVYGLVVMLAG